MMMASAASPDRPEAPKTQYFFLWPKAEGEHAGSDQDDDGERSEPSWPVAVVIFIKLTSLA
jgi:hypothetical protein